MYTNYFGLQELPFSLAPDPRYLFLSKRYQEALAHLQYGLQNDNCFILLSGEVGCGKTTVCRYLLDHLDDATDIAFIFNPKLTAAELLATICDEFGIPYPAATGSVKFFIDRINAYLLDSHARKRRTVLIIDEVQNLSPDVLEQIRLLTNLETSTRKLLQIILIGQSEIQSHLARPDLRQLSQRITARYHLGPMTFQEVAGYVEYRLGIAGSRQKLFSRWSLWKLYRLSGGIPRLINLICDRAMLGAYAHGRPLITAGILARAGAEVSGSRSTGLPAMIFRVLAFGGIIVAAGLIFFSFKGDFIMPRQPFSPQPPKNFEKIPTRTDSAATVDEETAREEPKQDYATDLAAALSPVAEITTLGAYRNLLRLWGVSDVDLSGNFCNIVKQYGLLCLAKRGSFDDLVKLDRPVILSLMTDEGTEVLGLMTSIQGNRIAIFAGEEDILIEVGDLARYWTGKFLLLWRPPPGYSDSIRPGHSGEAVAWLDRQLAGIQKREIASAGSSVHNEELVRHVKNFQFAEGLVPDGIAGVQTLIRINTRTGKNVPSLINKERHALHQ